MKSSLKEATFARPVDSKKSAHLRSFYQVLVLEENVRTSQVHVTTKV